MSWVRLDDHFPTHPKMVAAGGDAGWLHVCALCYCAEHLTDGVIPKAVIGRLSDRKQPERLAARLVEVGSWTDEGDSYRIKDFLEYNRSRAEVESERLAAKERRTNGGRASPNVRANKPRCSPDVRESVGSPDPTRPERPSDVSRRGRQVPDDWQPSDATRTWVREHYPAKATKGVLAAFKDHAKSKGRVLKDIDAAFRNWVRNEAKWHPEPEARGPGRTHL